MITASQVACKGMKIKPKGDLVSDEDQTCIACAAPIPAGEKHDEWKQGGLFTNWTDLAAPGNAVCRYCKPLVSKTSMAAVANTVITQRGAWKITEDKHLTWLLTKPPKPPFVATFKASMNSMHLVWRAPVTQDKDLILLQFEGDTLPIDRPLLLAAVKWAKKVADWARGQGIKVTPNHPFALLSRKREKVAHTMIRGDIQAAAVGHPEIEDLIERLQGLGEGELWGLSVLAKAKPEAPKAVRIA